MASHDLESFRFLTKEKWRFFSISHDGSSNVFVWNMFHKNLFKISTFCRNVTFLLILLCAQFKITNGREFRGKLFPSCCWIFFSLVPLCLHSIFCAVIQCTGPGFLKTIQSDWAVQTGFSFSLPMRLMYKTCFCKAYTNSQSSIGRHKWKKTCYSAYGSRSFCTVRSKIICLRKVDPCSGLALKNI